MSLGLPDYFEGPPPSPEAPGSDPRTVFLEDEGQLDSLARQVEAVAERESLLDYGRFRLAMAAIDQLPIDLDGELHTVAGAIDAGAWSAGSRLLAIGALLRAMGYAVVPHQIEDSSLLLGLPLEGDPKSVNANTIKANLRVRRGKGAAQSHVFRWLMWDGTGRIGDPRAGGTLVLKLPELLDGPQRGFSWVSRRIPAFTLQQPDPRVWPVHGQDRVLTWHQHEDARVWLAAFPALSFPHQARLAREELATLDITPSLEPLRTGAQTETELVDTLLRSVQTYIRYQEGPLRSLYDILEDRTGDCDQLSLVLQALLVSIGYELDDLRAFRWPDHLALGLRPREQGPTEGSGADEGTHRFWALDAAFTHRTGEELTSAWGMLNRRYARLGFKSQRLA